jgi:hypothetical protein
MLKKFAGLGVIASVVLGLIMFSACDSEDGNGNGPVDPCEGTTALTVTAPDSGVVLTVGTPVTISWCCPVDVAGVLVYIQDEINMGARTKISGDSEAIFKSDSTHLVWTPTVPVALATIVVQNYVNSDQEAYVDGVSIVP